MKKKNIDSDNIENLPLFPGETFRPNKKKTLKKFTEDLLNFSHPVFIFGGPVKETKDLIWEKDFGNVKYYLEGSSEAGGLPFGIYFRRIQIYVDTEIKKSKHGKGDIQFYRVGETKMPFIEFSDSMRGLAKILGIDPSGRNLKNLSMQFERFLGLKIIIEVKDPESGRITKEKVSLFPKIKEIWDPTKSILEKVLFAIDPDYFENVLAHGHPLIPEIIEELKKSSTHLDLYRFISYRYSSGFKHSVDLNELSELFGISSSHISKYFENVVEKTIKPLWKKHTNQDLFVKIIKGKNRYDRGKLIFAPPLSVRNQKKLIPSNEE